MPIKSSIRKSIRSGIKQSSAESRYFTRFDSSAQSYILLDQDYSFGGEYEWEFEYATMPLASTQQAIFGKTFVAQVAVGTTGQNGELRYNVGGGASWDYLYWESGTTSADGELHRAVFKQEDSNAQLSIDGNVAASGSNASPSGLYVRTIGRTIDETDKFFNGIIAGFKLWANGDRSGEPSLDIDLSTEFSPSNNVVYDVNGVRVGEWVNSADGDSVLYTRNSDGNWVDGNGNVLVVAYG